MSNEEALYAIFSAIEMGETINAGTEPYYSVLVCAEKALEKQIPKKPRINKVDVETEYMKCNQCKLTTVLYSDMRPDYCPKCGQKLDYRLE